MAEVHRCWRLNVRLLRASGLWPRGGSTVAGRALGALHWAVCVALFLSFYFSGAVIAFYSEGVHDLGQNLSVALTNTLTFVKLLPFLLWRRRVTQAIDRLGRDLYPAAEQLLSGAAAEALVRGAERRARRISLGVLCFVEFAALSAISAPLAELATHRCHPPAPLNASADHDGGAAACGGWQPRLPFNAWFPWDWTTAAAYPFTYILQGTGNVVTALMAAAADTYFIALLLLICSQFEMLSCALHAGPVSAPAPAPAPPLKMRVVAGAEESEQEQEQQRLPRLMLQLRAAHPRDQHLLRCVLFHQHLLKFVDDMRWVLSPVLLGESLVMTVVLCMITLHATSVPVKSVAFVSYLTFYLIEMGQLLLYCWFCSDIKDKSEEVSSAVYASDWISADPPMKHNLSIFMMRAASPVKLDAMGFVNVDLDLFTSVMQASYSFFTVLSQMKDTEGEK